jgi:hypothetical protein
MSNLRNFLTKKLGPFPAWVWGVIAVGALLAYRRFSGAGRGGNAAQTPTVTADVGTPDLAGGGSGSGGGAIGLGSPLDIGSLAPANGPSSDRTATEALLAGVVGELGAGAQSIAGEAVRSLGDVATVQAGTLGEVSTTLAQSLADTNASLISAGAAAKAKVIKTPPKAKVKPPKSKQVVKPSLHPALPHSPIVVPSKVKTGVSAGVTHTTTPAVKPIANRGGSSGGTTQTRFYTFRKDVPLSSGQTVHYTAGKGYYAA